uniref:Uncharacterized LOC114587121 n=1 Tax=Podarcis muralis TaxID=64176 RepID=A0A670K4E4_PODMU|nr:uncharacterized protein LOC114587121 [Podarcis muralis]
MAMNVTHRSLPVLLTFVLLISSSFGTSGEASINASQHVKGVVGGQVSFPVKVPRGKPVEKIEWDVISPVSGAPYRLCEFRDWKLKKSNFSTWIETWMNRQGHRLSGENDFVSNVMSGYIFGRRLLMADRATLTIREMERQDAVIYKARVWFDAEQFEDHFFNVTLYDPAPQPRINYYDLTKTPKGCDVTLKCQTNVAGTYNISWENVRALDSFSFSDNGRNLHVSWRKDSSHSFITCLLRNPADEKKAWFDLRRICQDYERHEVKSHEGSIFPGSIQQNIQWGIILGVLVPLICILVVICRCYEAGKSNQRNTDIPSVAQEEMAYRPPPENPMMNRLLMVSAPDSTAISPPTYDEVQADRNGGEGTLCSEPPAYDSISDCTASAPDACDCSCDCS